MQLQELQEALQGVKDTSSSQRQALEHGPVGSMDEWVQTLLSTHPSVIPTKTMVLKPSSKAKKQEPLMLLAGHASPLSLGALTKALGSKDARLAQDDYVQNLLGTSKMDGMSSSSERIPSFVNSRETTSEVPLSNHRSHEQPLRLT